MTHDKIDLPHLQFDSMAQAVRAGNLVTISGQVALGPDGLVGEGDARAQAEQVLDNIEDLVAAAGGSSQDLVKLTCYLVDAADYPAYAAAKAARFTDVTPAGTCVVVKELLDPRFLIEVEALAVIA